MNGRWRTDPGPKGQLALLHHRIGIADDRAVLGQRRLMRVVPALEEQAHEVRDAYAGWIAFEAPVERDGWICLYGRQR